jgi:hypothetical protein
MAGSASAVAEVSFVATADAAQLDSTLAQIGRRIGAQAEPLRLWRRTYASTLDEAQRGAESLEVLSGEASDAHVLRMESSRLPIGQHAKPRTPAVLQARRTTYVPAGKGAEALVRALGFEEVAEVLLRGRHFARAGARVAAFQLCRRRAGAPADGLGDDGSWEALGEGLWVVEARFQGEQLAPLVLEADALADALATTATLQPLG